MGQPYDYEEAWLSRALDYQYEFASRGLEGKYPGESEMRLFAAIQPNIMYIRMKLGRIEGPNSRTVRNIEALLGESEGFFVHIYVCGRECPCRRRWMGRCCHMLSSPPKRRRGGDPVSGS